MRAVARRSTIRRAPSRRSTTRSAGARPPASRAVQTGATSHSGAISAASGRPARSAAVQPSSSTAAGLASRSRRSSSTTRTASGAQAKIARSCWSSGWLTAPSPTRLARAPGEPPTKPRSAGSGGRATGPAANDRFRLQVRDLDDVRLGDAHDRALVFEQMGAEVDGRAHRRPLPPLALVEDEAAVGPGHHLVEHPADALAERGAPRLGADQPRPLEGAAQARVRATAALEGARQLGLREQAAFDQEPAEPRAPRRR